jgi:iron complex outermembrane receptor protein
VTPWIVNANATVNIPIPEALGALSLFVNYSHVSSQNTSPLSPAAIGGVPVEPGVLIEGYGLLNASIDWRNIGGRGLDASLFVTNLTNKLYRVSNSGVFQSLGVWSELYGEPRMYGLRLRYRFGS